MNWRASIDSYRKTGYNKQDVPWCSYGKIASKEEALKRAEKVFKQRKYSKETHTINVYESML